MTEKDTIALHILSAIISNGGIHGHIDGRSDAEACVSLARRYADVFMNPIPLNSEQD